MPSPAYRLFRDAILAEKQVTCVYNGRYRELCPVIIGHTNGVEKVLAYQFGGQSNSGLPTGGEWRCLELAKVRDIRVRAGPWHEGRRHQAEQTCVADVDIDVNIQVRRLRSG